jgi:hypothetical protein
VSRLLFLVLGSLLIGAQTASAESRSVSYSIWNVVEQSVHVRFVIPVAETRHLVQPGAPSPTNQAIADYLVDHVAVTSAGGACPAVDQGEEIGRVYTLSPSPSLRRFEIVFQCPQSNSITLQNSFLLDRVPSHLNFARIQVTDGPVVDQLFNSAHDRVALPAPGSEPSNTGTFDYARLGVFHVVDNLDRVCFVLAFLLIRCRREDIGYLLGGISLGYVLSFAVAVTGIITPRMELTQPLLAFLIVLVAAGAAARASKRPWAAAVLVGAGLIGLAAVSWVVHGTPAGLMLAGIAAFAVCYLPIAAELSDRAAFALVPATLFGLLDGFDFAATLSVLRLPVPALARMQFGFDAGALLAIGGFATAIVALVALIRARKFEGWSAVPDLAAAWLAGLGIFWFVGGLYPS